MYTENWKFEKKKKIKHGCREANAFITSMCHFLWTVLLCPLPLSIKRTIIHKTHFIKYCVSLSSDGSWESWSFRITCQTKKKTMLPVVTVTTTCISFQNAEGIQKQMIKPVNTERLGFWIKNILKTK